MFSGKKVRVMYQGDIAWNLETIQAKESVMGKNWYGTKETRDARCEENGRKDP